MTRVISCLYAFLNKTCDNNVNNPTITNANGAILLSSPLDVVTCFHNAFRKDISQIDAQTLNIAQTSGDPSPILSRLHAMDEILDYHARGEEAAVFPAVDNLAPLVAKSYLMDHRELDRMVENLENMLLQKSPNPLLVTRVTTVLNSHLRIHLDKEDAHLYPILREKTTLSQQLAIGVTMSSKIPPDRFPAAIAWLFALLELNDRVTVTKGWMTFMPPQIFANAKPFIKSAVGQGWDAIVQKIPELNDR
jgi:iron-sulfur cluster repair protein YtfE (RIC family)